MCRLLTSRNEIASGLPCEYLNSQFTGNHLRDICFKILDWAIPDIQLECEKLTLKEGYFYFKLQMSQVVLCDVGIRKDVESRYYGVQTNFSEKSLDDVIGKIVYFTSTSENIHKLHMCIEEDLSQEYLNQCGFV